MPKRKNILVIDDNELNRELLTYFLEDTYHVLSAQNGEEGLKVLEEYSGNVALMLLDIHMPVMSGYDFLEAIKSEGAYIDIPIIVMTSGDSDEEQMKCLDMGASDFIRKPYNPEIVKKRAECLIRLRETAIMLHKVEQDELTGLYNRESFIAYGSALLAANPSERYDMVCLEIESYRLLHSRYGTEKCEKLLLLFTENMNGYLPEGSLAGRVDEDKFAVLMKHIPFETYQSVMAHCGPGAFSAPIPNVKINCGVYSDVDHGMNISTIINNAGMPIERIRHRYDKSIAEFDHTIREKMAWEQMLDNEAGKAIEQRDFYVYYQPKFDTQRNCVCGAEALVRWNYHQFGILSPAEFIPLFESNGFIFEIDKYVLQTVCEDLRRWIDQGKKVVPVSVNISQVDFDRTELADVLEGIVDRYEIPHSLVHFEITETAEYSDKRKKEEIVKNLSSRGFLIELDDFGAGYSTLAALGELPIDVMKIDISLVRNMFDSKYHSILKGALYTAANLNLKVVAEGVETREQAETLRELCVNSPELFIQGFYYSHPLPARQFEDYLASGTICDNACQF